MQELIQFFIDQASIDPNHLTGMVIAGLVLVGMGMVFIGHLWSTFFEFFGSFVRRFKPIQIKKVQKIDKIVEVPKYVDNSSELKEILKKIKQIEEKQNSGVEL